MKKSAVMVIVMVIGSLMFVGQASAEENYVVREFTDQGTGMSIELTFDNETEADRFGNCYLQALEVKEAQETAEVTQLKTKTARKHNKGPKQLSATCCELLEKKLNEKITETKLEVLKKVEGIGLASEERDDALKGDIKKLEKDVDNLQKFSEIIGDVEEDIIYLDRRVSNLERNAAPIRFKLAIGATLGWSNNSTFKGVNLGAGLTSNLSPDFEVGIDLQFLLSVGNRPLGMAARGYVGLAPENRRVSGELGFGSYFCNYNDSAEAESLYLVGDLGLKVKLVGGFGLYGKVGLGSKISKSQPRLGVLGGAGLYYEF